ncbi:MAG: PEP/pyruvate-binding domain-containing protein [Gallibacter sp.]|nr:PEP/pyruvate-binding domain-containing protein [Gallibacter sp.]
MGIYLIDQLFSDNKIHSQVDIKDRFGGKASGLYLLYKNNFNIPKTIFIEKQTDSFSWNNESFKQELSLNISKVIERSNNQSKNNTNNEIEKNFNNLTDEDRYSVAIRSSSLQEDSFNASCAGKFNTYLGNFTLDEIISRLQDLLEHNDCSKTVIGDRENSLEPPFENSLGISLENSLENSLDNSLGNVVANDFAAIIQERIDADFSGVIFSSNPNNFSKHEIVVSYVFGIGDKLVSGQESGKELIINFDYIKQKMGAAINEENIEEVVRIDEIYEIDDSDNVKSFNKIFDLSNKIDNLDTSRMMDNKILYKICLDIKRLEKRLGYPIDVEWAVKDNIVYYLQCRPITSITNIKECFIEATSENLNKINNLIVSHDKLNLRKLAEGYNINISDAYIAVSNSCAIDDVAFEIDNQAESNFRCNTDESEERKYNCNMNLIYKLDKKISDNVTCRSNVIIYPKNINGKVIREFVGMSANIVDDGDKASEKTDKIISKHKYNSVVECIKSFNELAHRESWICTTIVQDVYNSQFTGAIKKDNGQYFIEITKGHFLTKGIVPTSKYVVDDENIIILEETIQDICYKIDNGNIKEQRYDEVKVCLDDNILLSVVKTFKKLLNIDSRIVEFGIIDMDSKKDVYLIDYIDLDDNKSMSLSRNFDGVISRGSIKGNIKFISVNDRKFFNHHYYDKKNVEKNDDLTRNTVFLAEKPDIALQHLISEFDENNIGFIFKEGSQLCHLAVLLRERGIPAMIVGNKFDELISKDGMLVSLDTISEDISADDRVVINYQTL